MTKDNNQKKDQTEDKKIKASEDVKDNNDNITIEEKLKQSEEKL